jgi:hypothetical protein
MEEQKELQESSGKVEVEMDRNEDGDGKGEQKGP